ncbi:MAG: hypothetical protein J5829_06850 [Lachnospiraceae bacterium]|nr:hypothetical protein [Lachnospiraceae bacterium]
MKKRILVSVLACCLTAALTACGSTAASVPDAVPDTAATGETEENTDPAKEDPCRDGHTWVEATCTKPKTCSVCGATEGEALGHEWDENTPNYQQAKTCSRCGQTEGNPLEAEFEKKGIPVETEWEKEYHMTVPCYQDRSKTTECKLSFTDFKRVSSDDDIGLKGADGYEWFIFDVTDKYDDENAAAYGFLGYWEGAMDYYDTYNAGGGDLGEAFEPGKTDIDSLPSFTVNYNGKEYPDCKLLWADYAEGGGWNEETMICINKHPVYLRVPVGYDGIVLTNWVVDSETDKEYQANKDESPALIDYITDECINFRVIPK